MINEKQILEYAQKAKDLAAKRKELMDKVQPILNECSDLQIEWEKCMTWIKAECTHDSDEKDLDTGVIAVP